jgi:hypothetical protein
MKYKNIFTLILTLSLSVSVAAQLSQNPWENKSPAQDKQKVANTTVVPGADKTENTLNQKLPDYVGSNTTWDIARGQEAIAPDVNITNMLLMTQHLRDLGYQIPDGLDHLITTAPEKLRRQILSSMQYLKRSNDPVSKASNAYAKIFEKQTGLSIQNLIENSLRILDARR